MYYFVSPYCYNFVSGSRHFICSEVATMNNTMALKNHTGFKYGYGKRFPRQFKDKAFVFKMLVDLSRSDVDIVKHMQVGRDMENSWIMFNHVKYVTDWTTLACHMYTPN